jgi:hypothetical protein
MTLIELPDDPAAALRAKAEAEGLTLEAWLINLADEELSMGSSPLLRSTVDPILRLQQRVKHGPEGWTIHDYINHDRR